MAIEEYVVGQPVRFIGRFYSDPELAEPVDPAEVKMWLRDPANADTEYVHPAGVSRDSTGVFSVVAVPDVEGDWKWRWETEDPVVVIQGMVTVYDRNAGS